MTGLPADINQTSTDLLPTYEDVLAARDEVQDLGETQRKFQELDEVHLSEVFLQSTEIQSQGLAALADLRHDLRRFVFPSIKSYIREVLLPFLPSTILSPIFSVAVRVNWDLQNFLAEEFDPEDDISSVLTITGGTSRAQALPCGEYMRQTWPQSGSNTLLAIKYALQAGSSCKCSSSAVNVALNNASINFETTRLSLICNSPRLSVFGIAQRSITIYRSW